MFRNTEDQRRKEGQAITNIIIAGHGTWPTAILRSIEMIGGDTENIECVEIGDIGGLDVISGMLEDKIQKLEGGDGILILLDLAGGSPFHAASRLYGRPDIEALAGVNVAMALEIAVHRREMSPKDLVGLGLEVGKLSMMDVFDTVEKQLKKR